MNPNNFASPATVLLSAALIPLVLSRIESILIYLESVGILDTRHSELAADPSNSTFYFIKLQSLLLQHSLRCPTERLLILSAARSTCHASCSCSSCDGIWAVSQAARSSFPSRCTSDRTAPGAVFARSSGSKSCSSSLNHGRLRARAWPIKFHGNACCIHGNQIGVA